MEREFEHRLTTVEDRSKSNTKRLDKLEENTGVLNSLASSVAVMAEKQGQIAESVEKLDGKVTALEERPRKRWAAIAEKILLAVVGVIAGAVVGAIIGKFGL